LVITFLMCVHDGRLCLLRFSCCLFFKCLCWKCYLLFGFLTIIIVEWKDYFCIARCCQNEFGIVNLWYMIFIKSDCFLALGADMFLLCLNISFLFWYSVPWWLLYYIWLSVFEIHSSGDSYFNYYPIPCMLNDLIILAWLVNKLS